MEDVPAGVDAKNVGAALGVGERELDSSVDTSRAKERGVERVGPE